MKIFKELNKLGYKHYTEHSVEELDNLPLGSEERIMEQALVLKWFREKYELFCWIEKFHVNETYIFQIPPANFTKIQGHYITYEEAELACLRKLIEIVKNK